MTRRLGRLGGFAADALGARPAMRAAPVAPSSPVTRRREIPTASCSALGFRRSLIAPSLEIEQVRGACGQPEGCRLLVQHVRPGGPFPAAAAASPTDEAESLLGDLDLKLHAPGEVQPVVLDPI